MSVGGAAEIVFVDVIAIVAGPPHENVTTPPPVSAALSAASVQEPGVPLPTTPAAGARPGRRRRRRRAPHVPGTMKRGTSGFNLVLETGGGRAFRAVGARGAGASGRRAATPRAAPFRLHSTISMRRLLAPLSAVLLLPLAFAACAPVTPAPRTAPGAAAETPGVPTDELHWLRGSAEYRADHDPDVPRRRSRPPRRRAPGGPRGAGASPSTPTRRSSTTRATRLELQRKGLVHTDAAWKAWVKRGERTAVPGAATFLAGVQKLGGRVAVVTNTAQSLCPDVAANLDAALASLRHPRLPPRRRRRPEGRPLEERRGRNRPSRPRAGRDPRLGRRQHPGLPRPEPGPPRRGRGRLRRLRRPLLRPPEPDLRHVGEEPAEVAAGTPRRARTP